MIKYLKRLLDASISLATPRSRNADRRPQLALSVDWSQCLVVIEVGGRADSLHFRAYAGHLEGCSVIEWVVGRLRMATGGVSEAVVLVGDAEVRRMRSALGRECDVSVHISSGLGAVFDLKQLAVLTQKPRVLLVDPTAALLPSKLFEVLLRYHAGAGNEATDLTGLPCQMSPLLIEAKG